MKPTVLSKKAFFWTYILNTPFWAIYNMLFLILYKELQASPLQIVIFMTLNPVAAILSLYWSSYVQQRPDRLKGNIMWALILGHIPFLFSPWVDNPWYYIFSSVAYMLVTRGVIPAWMEVLRLNIPGLSGRKLFANASSLSYIGSALFPFFFGWVMDDFTAAWRWIFVASACVSLIALYFQSKIVIDSEPKVPSRPFSEFLLQPWKTVITLLRKRPDFFRFQIGFMFGGFGLMVMKPVMPAFYSDVLRISYTELGVAIALCKGVGYASTSQIWAHFFGRVNIYTFVGIVILLASLYPLGLISATALPVMFYMSWLGYGVMQAGSEMAWKMSGSIFSGSKDSSPYTSANVLMVGLRGCIAPPLGGLMVSAGYSVEALLLGALLCFIGSLAMLFGSKEPILYQSAP